MKLCVAGVRDAYHTLKLASDSQTFHGSPNHYYLRIAKGLSVSLDIWHQFINNNFENIPHHERHKIIMNDAMILSALKQYFEDIAKLFKAMINLDLTIPPQRC